MKIGLVDIDGHAKKKKWGATIYPNLALCKIARWHKEQGDEVEWASPMFHYDVVYMSKVFNFSPDDTTVYQADRIVRGGTGYDIKSQLPDEIAIEGRTKLVLMDNNILAAGDYAVSQLEKIIERGYRVDFNQALDARLVDDRFARLLAQVRWIDRRIRFGCDTHAQIAECERAISMINGYGYHGEYFLYTMIGGKSDFRESYERTHYWWLRNHECREKHLPNIYPYAQPYRDPDNPHNYPPQWQKDMAQWCNKHQIFQISEFKDFSPRKGFKCEEYLNEFLI